MGVSKAGIKYLHVSVFRGGAEIGKCARPLAKKRSVTAGRGAFCDIKSVIWPLLDELEIILKTKDGLILNPKIAWDGVLHNGSTTHVLGAPGQRKKSLPSQPQPPQVCGMRTYPLPFALALKFARLNCQLNRGRATGFRH